MSRSFTFRTLAGTQSVDVLPHESNQRHFGVSPNRIVIETVGDEPCVVVLDPIKHDPNSAGYRCPPGFLELYQQNLDRVNWAELSGNPGAIDILRANLDKVDWRMLSRNPNAIDLLTANMDKVDWIHLSANPKAADILSVNVDKVEWSSCCEAVEWTEY